VVGGAFVYGLIIGSFLNVVIHRVPRGESIVTPRSRCPDCGHPIPWYENIPILSYLALGGRCRACRQPISPRYAAVELLTGLVFAGLISYLHWSLPFLKYMVFAALMIALAFIDLEQRLLPDVLTLPGIAAGLALSLLVPVGDGMAAFLLRLPAAWPRLSSFADSLLGAIVAAGLLWLVGELYFRLRRAEGLGFGDVKLMALVGAFLGIKLALLTIFLGSIAGSLIGGAVIWARRKGRAYELPFGTFLGFMALFAAVWGKEIVRWYLSRAF
jgi:leader peptidase (prepilin peptidase)/N-methyltransferase